MAGTATDTSRRSGCLALAPAALLPQGRQDNPGDSGQPLLPAHACCHPLHAHACPCPCSCPPTLTCHWLVTSRFADFKSRWKTGGERVCRYSMPLAASPAMLSRRSQLSGLAACEAAGRGEQRTRGQDINAESQGQEGRGRAKPEGRRHWREQQVLGSSGN